jgi:hypothetical protein
MVFTTVAPETRDGPTVFPLSRCRWQVELAFQRLKILLDLDALRPQQNSRLGEVWIRGKWLDARLRRRRLQTLPARVIEMMNSKGGQRCG